VPAKEPQRADAAQAAASLISRATRVSSDIFNEPIGSAFRLLPALTAAFRPTTTVGGCSRDQTGTIV
jgi:hypothetical protein